MSNVSCGSASDPHGGHVFEAIRYLRNVCNHPKLVLSPKHPLYQTVSNSMLINETKPLPVIIHFDRYSLIAIFVIRYAIR